MTAAGCAKTEKAKPGPDSVIATYKGGKITVADFMTAAEGKAPDEFKKREEILANLIKYRLLSRQAHADGLVSGPEIASDMEQTSVQLLPGVLKKSILDNTKVSDEEIEAYRKKETAAEFDVTMIIAKTQDRAEESLKEIESGKSFNDVLKEHPGEFTQPDEIKKVISLKDKLYSVGVRAALNRLKPGELAPIMKLEIGYAVCRLNKRLSPEEQWEHEKQAAIERLKNEKAAAEIDALTKKLYAEANIKIEKVPGGYEATVNGTKISHQGLMSTETSSDPHSPHAGMNERSVLMALNGVIKDLLLANEAKRRGLDKDPGYRKNFEFTMMKMLTDRYIEKVNDSVTVTPQDVRDYYEKNKKKLANEELTRVSRILLDNADTAKEVESKLKAGESFSTLAEQYSKDTDSGPKGGDVGWVEVSKMREPLSDTIYNLKVGEVSEPIRSDYGYEILMVTERRPSVVPPFSEVEATCRKRALLNKFSDKLEALMAEQYKDNGVKVNLEVLKAL